MLERQWRSRTSRSPPASPSPAWRIVGPAPTSPRLDRGRGRRGDAARLRRRRTRSSIWSWTFGLLGAALRFCSGASAVRRYLADASYWLYLAHLPIVFGLQVLLMNVPLHWTVKFPLILAHHARRAAA